MYELWHIVAGGEYSSLKVGTYDQVTKLSIRLWRWFGIVTFIKEVE
jgi:hypothetical protein